MHAFKNANREKKIDVNLYEMKCDIYIYIHQN